MRVAFTAAAITLLAACTAPEQAPSGGNPPASGATNSTSVSATVESSEERDVAKAKQLLDTTYSKNMRSHLEQAEALLEPPLTGTSQSASAYVQAARLIAMSDALAKDRLGVDQATAYHMLLDKALAIEPKNSKAFILKAEAFDLQKNYAQELVSLDRAKELGSKDPWLLMGYARYFERIAGSTEASYQLYRDVVERGAGQSDEERRAFVRALVQLGQYEPQEGDVPLRSLAVLAWKERHPDDAITLGSFAEYFVRVTMFDDAIVYQKEALRTMDYGAGRVTLASALYGKAAQLVVDGKAAEADKYLTSARAMGYRRSDIFSRYVGRNEQLQGLLPTLRAIVQ